MKINRGKDFEHVVQMCLDRVSDVAVTRLYDTMNGFSGVANISDYIVYRYPHLMYLECKAIYGNTLNFHLITDKQWTGMAEKAKTPGVVAGVMIWYIDHDYTVFVPIQELNRMKHLGKKSVHVNDVMYNKDVTVFPVPGHKLKVFFDYNMADFLETLWEGYDELSRIGKIGD